MVFLFYPRHLQGSQCLKLSHLITFDCFAFSERSLMIFDCQIKSCVSLPIYILMMARIYLLIDLISYSLNFLEFRDAELMYSLDSM